MRSVLLFAPCLFTVSTLLNVVALGEGTSFPNNPAFDAWPDWFPILGVDIDIKPGSDPNCFNNDGNGVIPVAILGSAAFEVTQVDDSTVILEGLAIKVAGKKGKLLSHIEDTNADGFDDLVASAV